MGCSQSAAVAPYEVPPEKEPRLKSKKSSTYSYLELQQTPSGTYVISPRTKMKLQVSKNEDFLTHHLSNELCLSPYASAYKIRARQIIQHYMFNDLSHNIQREQSTSRLTQFALKAWFQRTFIDCLQRAENQYFQHDASYDSVRERIAQQYSFQIFKMGQFINAGLGKFGDGKTRVKVPLSLILFNSDSALFALLARLQQKYPLVQQDHSISYPEVKTMNKNINLLKLIDSQCYSDPKNLNIQTIFDDLKLLIDEANDFAHDFKTDMVQLLGKDALTDCKVKRGKQGDNITYNASAMRRVFIKWSQTLIQRIPDACILPQFIDFIRSKKDMANNFIFKSVISQTTHQIVIKRLSELMQSLKYRAGSSQQRQEFGLFLYDLLRCKTTRKTGQQVASLLQTLKNVSITASGKRFQVVRVKNRFKSATRDILVNFRYGEHLIAEAQLCIDSPHDSIEVSKRIMFRHYLYELERGLFGPTFELIMQYEDFSRKDICVTLKALGKLKKRNFNIEENKVKKAGRTCPQRHEMVSIKGNIFSQTKFSEMINDHQGFFNCDFCFQKTSLSKEYHYCYYCTSFYCLKCLNVYKSTDFSRIYWSCNQYQLLTYIKSEQQVTQICKEDSTALVIAYQEGQPASKFYLDQIIYLLSTYPSQGKPLPKVYAINLGHNSHQKYKKKYQITRIPTTILLDKEQQPQLTLVGSTFHDIQDFFEVQRRIQSSLPKGIKIKCNICNELMSSQKEFKSQKCQMCMDTNKIEDIGDLIRAFRFTTKDFVCKNGHVKCNYCSYLSSNKPSYFRDHTGRSYLSNKILMFPKFCQNLHMMTNIPQPNSFNCHRCKQKIESISTDGDVYCCVDCKEYICDSCLQTQSSNFREQEIKEQFQSFEIVSHFVEDQAEEAWPCGCGNLFLKVYQTKRQKKKGIHSLLDRIMCHRQNQWGCFICKAVDKSLKLHFACFYCPYAKKISTESSHIQICMNCCMKTGLIDKKKSLLLSSVRQSINLKCSKGHLIAKKNGRQNQQTYFECISCKENFYSNTERYECQQCHFKCCGSCADRFLIDPNQPVTTRSCQSGHKLVLRRQKPPLQFCKGCSKYLQGSHFSCESGCRFSLCLKCSKT